MSDHLLTSPDRQEALSRAYLQAVAAGAGYVVATMDFDRDGIDAQIQAGGLMRPALGVQLKATINLGEPVEGSFKYPLNRRNYDLLIIETQVPRILVILDLPRSSTDWLKITSSELSIRRSAFWVWLKGFSPSTNETSVTIPIPESNKLDVSSLQELMDKSRTGSLR